MRGPRRKRRGLRAAVPTVGAALPFACALALTGCSGSIGDGPVVTAPAALNVCNIQWNGGGADVGTVNAVADFDKGAVVFGTAGAVVMVGGSAAAVDARVVDWRGAATIPAGDGEGSWVVGVSSDGRLHRLRQERELEDVTVRYGLEGIRAVAGLGGARSGGGVGPLAAFAVEGGLAVADGQRVTRYADASFASFAGGGGKAAAVVGDEVRVLDGATGRVTQFPLSGVRHVAVDENGRVTAATADDIFVEGGDGKLRLRVQGVGGGALSGLARSRDETWFAANGRLGVIGPDGVQQASDASLPQDATLVGSTTGGVWVLSNGALQRFTRTSGGGADCLWFNSVSSIFGRVCATCHLPGGSGGDLSRPEIWSDRRDRVRQRVVEDRTMPPAGYPITEEERATLAAWLSL